jgi:hypothetical protein
MFVYFVQDACGPFNINNKEYLINKKYDSTTRFLNRNRSVIV